MRQFKILRRSRDRRMDEETEADDTRHPPPLPLPPNGIVRRVTFDDLESIMDINDDVYEGLDYMRSLFYTFLHSKQHEMYVYEQNGQAISFVNLQFQADDDRLVAFFSGRVRPSHQNQGYAKLVFLPLVIDHSRVTTYLASTLYKPHLMAKVNDWKVNSILNFLLYKLTDRPGLERFVRTKWKLKGFLAPFPLSYSDGVQWLTTESDQLKRFISRYSSDFIPFGPVWAQVPISESGLRKVFANAKVLVTFGDVETSASKKTSTVTWPDHEGCSDRWSRRQLAALSYSTCLKLPFGVGIDVSFYGDDCDVFVSHVASHLLHYVSRTEDDVTLVCGLQFPQSVVVTEAEERLSDCIGPRIDSRYFSVTQVIHYCGQIHQSKL